MKSIHRSYWATTPAFVFCLGLMVGSASFTAAAITLPQNIGHLDVTGTVSARYDSNIFSSRDAVADFLVGGEARVAFRRQAAFALSGNVGLAWEAFTDRSDQTFADPTFGLAMKTAMGVKEIDVRWGGSRHHEADSILGERIERWSQSAGFSLTSPLVGHLGYTTEITYNRSSFVTEGLQDIASGRVGVDLAYALTPKISALLGGTIGFDQTDLRGRSADRTYTVGLSRQLLPKVNGNMRVGWVERDNRAEAIDLGTFTASADFTWRPVDRLSLVVNAGRDIRTIPSGRTVVSSYTNLSAEFQFKADWSATLATGWSETSFPGTDGRGDRGLLFSGHLARTLNSHLSIMLGGSFIKNFSDRNESARFDRVLVNLSITTRL